MPRLNLNHDAGNGNQNLPSGATTEPSASTTYVLITSDEQTLYFASLREAHLASRDLGGSPRQYGTVALPAATHAIPAGTTAEALERWADQDPRPSAPEGATEPDTESWIWSSVHPLATRIREARLLQRDKRQRAQQYRAKVAAESRHLMCLDPDHEDYQRATALLDKAADLQQAIDHDTPPDSPLLAASANAFAKFHKFAGVIVNDNAETAPLYLPWDEKSGKAAFTQANLEHVLGWLGVSVRYNLLVRDIEIKGLEAQGFGPLVTDICLDWLTLRLRDSDIRLNVKSSDTVFTVLRQIAWANRYHPIKDYLESISWDRRPRLDTWVIDHAGAEDTQYTRAVCALPLLAAVKRLYQPGSKFDELLVLCSPQGWTKSSALRAMLPDTTWFGDDLPLGVDSKSVLERTKGRWIIEAADLKGFGRVDHNTLKSFMSRTVDTAREAYARQPTDVPRQWVLIGTVNDSEFLDDPTGDRRYWPVTLRRQFDLDRLIAERDQIWAEAYHRVVVLGESIRMDRSLWAEAEHQRAAHTVSNPLQDKLAVLLAGKVGCVANSHLWDACAVPMSARKGSSLLRQAMTALGWSDSSRKYKGHTVRCWHNTDASNQWLIAMQSGAGWQLVVEGSSESDSRLDWQPAAN